MDRAALDTVKKLGMVPVEVSIPDWPYDSLNLILFAEAARPLRSWTLNDEMDRASKSQVPDAWPNIFREARFLSAVDFVQADRLRGAKSHRRWRVSSRKLICFWCLRCATRC